MRQSAVRENCPVTQVSVVSVEMKDHNGPERRASQILRSDQHRVVLLARRHASRANEPYPGLEPGISTLLLCFTKQEVATTKRINR
eukprot:gene33092-40837_t